MRIKYASSPAGSGKTHQLVKTAVEKAVNGERVLILQPTKELIDKTVQCELPISLGFNYFVIHGDVVKDEPVSSVLARTITDYDAGCIVFSTHQAFARIPYVENKGNWTVLIDEEMQIASHHAHRLPRTHHLLTDFIALKQKNSTYSFVSIKNRSEFEDRSLNKNGDEILEMLEETNHAINNSSYECVVDTELYHKLLDGRGDDLDFHSILKPSILEGYGEILMAAANFEDTLIYKIWSSYGVTFEQDRTFINRLRYQTHSHCDLISIYYILEGHWSRRRMESPSDVNVEGSPSILEKIVQEISGTGSEERFVWHANKRSPDDIFRSNAIRLPNKSHGLNNYINFDNSVILSSLNPAPEHFKFLMSCGLSDDEVRTAIYCSAVYQAVLRTSIRDPSNKEHKWIIVPDQQVAEYLQSNLPGSCIEHLDIGIVEDRSSRRVGRPRKHTSDAARMAAKRQARLERKRHLLADLASLQRAQDGGERGCGPRNQPELGSEIPIRAYSDSRTQVDAISGGDPCAAEGCNEGGSILPDFKQAICCGTFYDRTTATQPIAYLRHLKDEEIAAIFEGYNEKRWPSKDKIPLISPAVFDPNLPTGKKRGRDNIVYLCHVWLDFENGDLRPEEFPKLFPQVKMIVTNTYGHTNDLPRFRVILFGTGPMTPDAYESIYDEIAAKLESAGYVTRRQAGRPSVRKLRSGLDWSKRSSTSPFYIPAQARDPGQSFFKFYDGPEREQLDPVVWIRNAVAMQPDMSDLTSIDTACDGEKKTVDIARVRRATEKWHQAPEGTGNDEFFRLAIELRAAGMEPEEIRATLRRETGFARHPDQRLAQIPSVMDSLRSRRRWLSLKAHTR